MFFSTDLLSIRGGKFGTVWLLATTKDRKSVIKKKKAELLKTDMTKLCQELIKMFPVQGKHKSFSLRTSSILVYGTCINLRLLCEDLRKSVVALLGHRAGGQGVGGIDLPGGHMPTHLARLEVPTNVDLDLGNINLTELEDVFLQVDFRVRPSDITMLEHDLPGLEYEGLELPILSTKDILTESWSLDDTRPAGGLFMDQEVGQASPPPVLQDVEKGIKVVQQQDGCLRGVGLDEKIKRTLPSGEEVSSPKRARLEEFFQQHLSSTDHRGERPVTEDFQLDSEETLVEQGKEGDLTVAAPARLRLPSAPTIEVTPAVSDDRRRKRTPTMLDMEAVAGDQTLPLPHSPPGLEDLPPPPQLPSPPHLEDISSPQLDLQPLVTAPARQARTGKRKQGLVWVDIETQITSDSIRQGMNSYRDTMRCQEVSMDLAKQMPKAVFTGPGRDHGMVLGFQFKEGARLAGLGQVVAWDWDERQDIVDMENIESEDVLQEVERQNAEVESNVEVSRQDSRIEERRVSNFGLLEMSEQGNKIDEGSFPGLPQAESSRIAPSEQGEVVNRGLGDILEEEDVGAKSVGEGLLPPVEDLDHTPVLQQEQHQEDMQLDVEINYMNLDQLQVDQPLLSPPPLSPNPISSQATVLGKVTQLTDESGCCCFSSICPPTSTSRMEAAITFFHLLQIEKEGHLVSSQEQMFADINFEMVKDA